MSDKPADNKTANKNEEVLLEKARELENKKPKTDASFERENTARILNEKTEFTPAMSDEAARKLMGKYSRRGFLIGGAAAVFGYLGYGWLRTPDVQDKVFRRTFEFNEQVSQLYYSPANLAPEFPREKIGNLRVNGGEGMSQGFQTETWRLQVVGLENPKEHAQYADNIAYQTAMDNESEMRGTEELHHTQDSKNAPNAEQQPPTPPPTMDRAAAMQAEMPGLLLNLDDIKALPRVEMTTELKCIEGWSTIVNWTGARFSDFVQKFAPPAGTKYVSLVTPDGGYYVGMDMPSMLHPQTLLAYEMNGAALTLPHGAPLRLVTATKYGIKQIKRIGRIAFTNERPADFWAERGYDWYAGH